MAEESFATLAGPVMVWIVGVAPTLMVTVLLLGGQTLLEIVHSNTFAPILNPLTDVIAEAGLVNIPAPLTTVHAPVPILGVLADKAVDVVVMYWVVPAIEAVGGAFTVTTMADLGLSQVFIVCDT